MLGQRDILMTPLLNGHNHMFLDLECCSGSAREQRGQPVPAAGGGLRHRGWSHHLRERDAAGVLQAVPLHLHLNQQGRL